MSKRRFEMSEGGTSKFWQVEQIGSDLHVAWGKIGTAGQSQVKSFGDEARARAAVDTLIKEKTSKGYVGADASSAADPPAPESTPLAATSTKLSYVIADFDAEDTYAFEVRVDASALEVRRGESTETVAAEALESAPGVWVLLQGSRTPDVVDAKRTPPFVVSRALRDALALGECLFTTGFNPDREIALTKAELDALDEDAAEVVSSWKGPKLVARSDEGDELVIANAEVPQLLYFRTDDVCTISWSAGVLDGATKKAPKPKPKEPAGKKQPAAEIAASPTASRADRIKAIKSLGKSASDEAITVLSAQLLATEREISVAAHNELSRAYHARRNEGRPVDVLPMLRDVIANGGEVPIPGPGEGDLNPVSGAIALYFTMLQSDERGEVTSMLRTVAWTSPRGVASPLARSILASRGDADAIERVSSMLLDRSVAMPAAQALIGLGVEVGGARAKAQIAAAEGEARTNAVMSLFNQLDLQPPGAIDAAGWWKILREPLEASPYMGSRLGRWRDKHGLR